MHTLCAKCKPNACVMCVHVCVRVAAYPCAIDGRSIRYRVHQGAGRVYRLARRAALRLPHVHCITSVTAAMRGQCRREMRTLALCIIERDAARKSALTGEWQRCILARYDGNLRVDASDEAADDVGGSGLVQGAKEVDGAPGEVRRALGGVAYV